MPAEESQPIRLRHRLEAAALGGLLRLLRALPARTRYALAGRVGEWARHMDRRHARVARESLALRYGEETADQKVREVFRELGHLAGEMALLERLSPQELQSMVTAVEGREHLEATTADPRGVLILSVHGGNWELLAQNLPHYGLNPLHVVYRPLDNPLLEDRLRACRERHGVHAIDRRRSSREVLEALRRGETVAMLMDQHLRDSTRIWLPFLGEPVRVPTTFARFAKKSGCLVLPAFMVREGAERFRLVFLPTIEPDRFGDDEDGIRDLTAETVAAMEAGIALAPAQWFWVHRRWRSEPRALLPDQRQPPWSGSVRP
ncbi:lysophospholipid acyltransferase family protein [Thiohalorhabdus methylotrophus]|uniref:Lysophospholipid acyltransferase family protein n=1 Tax=Thiohalorhabdus methylotrophus TaxID=3242694 RepID=A0ABV4TPN1_9GAMM